MQSYLSYLQADLYSCQIIGNALIELVDGVIGGPFIVFGHSSGEILATYVAAKDPDNVTACVLEDPPFFNVLPDEFIAALKRAM